MVTERPPDPFIDPEREPIWPSVLILSPLVVLALYCFVRAVMAL